MYWTYVHMQQATPAPSQKQTHIFESDQIPNYCVKEIYSMQGRKKLTTQFIPKKPAKTSRHCVRACSLPNPKCTFAKYIYISHEVQARTVHACMAHARLAVHSMTPFTRVPMPAKVYLLLPTMTLRTSINLLNSRQLHSISLNHFKK